MKKIINRTNGKILGSIIKMNRLHQNMSQKALSEGICVSSYLSRIENAEIIPSEQVISELFDALAIHYDDSEAFLEAGEQLLKHFLDELNFNEFSTSKQLFEAIESQAMSFRHSPLIIDYTIARLAFYCTRKERDIFNETRELLLSVEALMTNLQKFRFYLYDGIDHAKVYTDPAGAHEKLLSAAEYGMNGHLYYWLGFTELEMGKTVSAFKWFDQALNQYVDEANLISIIGATEMLGMTLYHSGDYNTGLQYFERGLKLAKKLGSPAYIASIYSNIAWGRLCLDQYQEALNIPEEHRQYFTTEISIHYGIIAFLANLGMENPMCIHELEPLFSQDEKPLMKQLYALFKMPVNINWSEKIIDHEPSLKRLIDSASTCNSSLAHYFIQMLIRYYKSNRRYKEALELQENIMGI
ncbi:MAG: tetratricopeptide repeat protein [Firmicutes bacterium]|nr:tetratricopeptide repeat protein [Bacillota bacterium]